jgi:hypothetical protein
MNPTHLELATLAAAFPQIHDPTAKIDAAMDIWAAAGKRLKLLQERDSQISAHVHKYESDRERIMGGIEFPPGTIKLDTFLSKTMPGRKGPDQMRIFREFLAVPNPAMPKGVESLPDIRENGIGEAFVYSFAHSFRRWLEAYDSKNRKMKASLGGKARHSKGVSAPPQKKSLAVKSSPKSTSSRKAGGPS